MERVLDNGVVVKWFDYIGPCNANITVDVGGHDLNLVHIGDSWFIAFLERLNNLSKEQLRLVINYYEYNVDIEDIDEALDWAEDEENIVKLANHFLLKELGIFGV